MLCLIFCIASASAAWSYLRPCCPFTNTRTRKVVMRPCVLPIQEQKSSNHNRKEQQPQLTDSQMVMSPRMPPLQPRPQQQSQPIDIHMVSGRAAHATTTTTLSATAPESTILMCGRLLVLPARQHTQTNSLPFALVALVAGQPLHPLPTSAGAETAPQRRARTEPGGMRSCWPAGGAVSHLYEVRELPVR